MLCYTGCNVSKKNASTDNEDEFLMESSLINVEGLTSLPKWIPGNYPRVAIVFGYGYEDDITRNEIILNLATEFGLAENGGLLIPLLFPTEYLTGKRIRTSFLRDVLKDYNLDALILISSPERTHFSLADLQDSGIAYPIYSIFPQDDVLGTESGSSFVLDYKKQFHATDDESLTESYAQMEQDSNFSGDITKIIVPLIKRIQITSKNNTAPELSNSLADNLEFEYKEILGDCEVTPFVDPESGLRSLNHFVLGVY